MYLTLLIVSLGILLLLDYLVFFKRELTSPAFLFAAGFFICSLNLTFFIRKWNVNIHEGTYWLVFGGVLAFTLGCGIIYAIKGHTKLVPSSLSEKDVERITPFLSVKRLKFLFVMIVFLCFVKAYFIMSYYGGGSLAASLVLHTEAIKFGDDAMKLPFGLSFLVSLPDFCGNIFAYLSAVYCFKKNSKNQRNWIWANFVLCMVGSLLSSGRTSMLWMIVVFGVSYSLSMKRHNVPINVRKVGILLLSIYVFAMSFQQLGYLIGRKESEDSSFSIFAEYCGAELQNLDDFIYNDHRKINTRNFGEVTFEGFWANFNVKSHRDEVLYFNTRRGYSLGNVRTTFHSYFIDFGLWGTYAICLLIGMVLQSFYGYLKNRDVWQTGKLTVPLYIFISLVPACFMSFFSEYFVNRFMALLNYRLWISYVLICYILYGKNYFKRKKLWIK